MSLPGVGERPVRLTPARRTEALLAVAVARPLAKLRPHRLRRVLALLSRGARPASPERALRARQSAVTVSARCAGLGCLQRSVAVALLCRLHGEWPDWCAGFRVRPFGAHAWVEVAGRPVGEAAAIDAFRTVLAVRHQGRGPARSTRRRGRPGWLRPGRSRPVRSGPVRFRSSRGGGGRDAGQR